MAKNVINIPGTDIPFMGSKRYGATAATAQTGRFARTAGLRGVQNELKGMIAGGIVAVVGGKQLLANVEETFIRLAWLIEQGTGNAVAFLRYDMDKTPPLIPMDTGALRESWFSRPIREISGKNYKIGTIAGFGGSNDCDYAIYVHEMTDEAYGKKINWSRPNSGPKFLEKALQRNKEEIVAIVVKTIKAGL
jgi:hypothetical protein